MTTDYLESELAIGDVERARAQSARWTSERAPFALRCGALLVDYTLVAGIAAFSTLLARLFGGGSRTAGSSVMEFGFVVALAVALLNFFVLPGFTGRTVGKWATGLRIERRDGEPLDFLRALARHTVGYLVSLLPLGLGFLLAAFNREGRALHDRLVGTVVVRDGARLR
ncbi:MAG: RDD family protein [Pyrinomonadaceae bacterium]